MVDAVQMATQSMGIDQQRLLVAAQNMAHASTPAYKSLATVVQTVVGSPVVADFGSLLSNIGLQLNTVQDRTVGTIRPTGKWSDLAIQGDGYFEFEGPGGPVYGRRGDFSLDAEGRLVNSAGLAVMTTGGPVVLTSDAVTIDSEGRIDDGGHYAGQIKMVQANNPDSLTVRADGHLRPGRSTRFEPARASLRQGFLENSNVDAAREMVHVIEILRHYETSQRVLLAYDEMLSRSLERFAEL